MNEPKQHHYVHESYLENFCDKSGSIHVFDKWDKGSQFMSTPKKVLKQGYYYSHPVHSEERFDISLENLFSEIETDWPSIVKLISDRQKLINETYMRFCEIVCMLRARVPNTRKALEICLQDTAQKLMREDSSLVPDNIAPLF